MLDRIPRKTLTKIRKITTKVIPLTPEQKIRQTESRERYQGKILAENLAQRELTTKRVDAQYKEQFKGLYRIVKTQEFKDWYLKWTNAPWDNALEGGPFLEMYSAIVTAERRSEYEEEMREIDALRAKYHAHQKMEWYRSYVGEKITPAQRRCIIQILATPPWVDADKIKALYRERDEIITKTGVKHHVDHEIPLQHKLVCGLHVHFNLQIIPATENLQKSNRFTID